VTCPEEPGDPKGNGGARLRKGANTELVFTPTYASFLNRIECHFWGIGEFVINNADYPSWDALAKAMADHIRYRNGPHRDQRLIASVVCV
jgi:hypothetical protein